jgi:hypothetical protein
MLEFSAKKALLKLIIRVVKLIMIFFLALPGLLLNLPLIVFTRYVSSAKQASRRARVVPSGARSPPRGCAHRRRR